VLQLAVLHAKHVVPTPHICMYKAMQPDVPATAICVAP
jgi:hypothetical protein